MNSRIDQHRTCWGTKDSNGQLDKLQRMLNAAAYVIEITGIRKFDRGLGQILHDKLHWREIRDRISFKLAVTVRHCLNCCTPPYLSEHCFSVFGDGPYPAASAFCQRCCSILTVPRFQQLWPSGFFSRCLHGLELSPQFFRDPTISSDCSIRFLKNYLFGGALWVIDDDCAI